MGQRVSLRKGLGKLSYHVKKSGGTHFVTLWKILLNAGVVYVFGLEAREC